MPTPFTGTLALPSSDPAPSGRPVPVDDDASPVQPADLVTALTGVTLGFFALFIHGITEWRYVGAVIERASVLGWLAPALAGLLCLVTAVVSVAVRAARRESRRRPSAPTGAASTGAASTGAAPTGAAPTGAAPAGADS
ncbi:hypothetical protein HQQ82_05445 [Rathayibacter sp. VKM Ac-2856]|uniref:hypothetical protein n=1 Tax=unclassified Rathayibacter TaxID=2609250 RepID=UPI001565C979|nr:MULTISPECIES: hypothetical protein [unclassified Rathayibacter]NQX04241.1 hypothetical protein [Rathayibacter sp. VKM Ac-2858]NQX19410.1 hypothetical protein [Rathayibacter sp. VKM Ac-2856]